MSPSHTRSPIRRRPHVKPMFAGLRHYDRKDAQLHVTVVDKEGWAVPFESVNISQSGIFIASDYLYDIGSVHTLVLQNGEERVELQGQVVRVERRPLQDDPAGMAYKFLEVDAQTFEHLSSFVVHTL